MECPKCRSVFYGRRSFSQHFRHCRVSLPSTASVYNCPSPILQHEAVDVINDTSSTINVAAAAPNKGFFSTTTSSSHLNGSSYAASLSAGLHVDSSYLSPGVNAIVIDQHLLPVVLVVHLDLVVL